jgi:hydroxymethylglutaryl-CoA lyase
MEKKVEITETGPREGFQYHKKYIDTSKKISLIEMLFDAGFQRVQVTSFVHPKSVPQMRDAVDVLREVRRIPGRICQVLVPNEIGCRNAIAAKADELMVWTFLEEKLNCLSQNRTIPETFKEIGSICEIAGQNNIEVSAYIVGAFGYNKIHLHNLQKVKDFSAKLIQLGCRSVCIGDDFCIANPFLVKKQIEICLEKINASKLEVYFHDNKRLGLANLIAAYEEGIRSFHCTLGGGNDFNKSKYVSKSLMYDTTVAPGVPTEDFVYVLEEMGISTGIDIEKLIECGRTFEKLLERKLYSRILANRLFGKKTPVNIRL